MGNYKNLILSYVDQIWRRCRNALIFAWVVCTLGWIFIALLPDKYSSEARVYVDTQSLLNPLLKGISVRSDQDPRREQDVAIMQRTLTSRPNLVKVAQLTDLDKSAVSTAELQSLIDDLQNRIEVTNQGNNLFRVRFTDNSAVMAKRVVQALLTIFVENNVGDRRADMQTARTFIEAQLEEYAKKLADSERLLADFKVKNAEYLSSGNENFSTRVQTTRDAVENRNAELEDLNDQRAQLKTKLDATPQFLSIDSAPQVVMGETNPVQARIRLLQARIDEMRLLYTDKHPEVQRALQALKELQDQQKKAQGTPATPGGPTASGRDRSEVANEVYNQLALRLADLDSKITSAKRRYEEAQREFALLQKQSAEGPKVEAQFTALMRDYQVLKASYDSLLQRRESAHIAEAADSSADSVQFRIIAQPEEPAFPTGPKRRVFNIAILILGLGAGCGFAVLLAKLEDCVVGLDDLKQFRNRIVLGGVSRSVGLAARPSFVVRHKAVLAAAGGLALVALIMIAVAPNLSTIPQAVVTRLAAL